jgi:hypothetical protein
MRDYQTKQNLGGAADSITATKFGAGEFNSLATENENAVTRAGLTLANQDGAGEQTNQLAQSLFLHGTKSSTMTAGGTVDAITLTPKSGVNGVLLPTTYDNFDGGEVQFLPTGTNTGAVTISIGQDNGSQIGTKKALTAAGADFVGGELAANQYVSFVYDASADSSNGAFIITNTNSFAINETLITVSGTYNPPAGVRLLEFVAMGGGGGGGGVDGQGSGTTTSSVAGAGGGWSKKLTSIIESSYTITIGAGGTGAPAGNNDGTAGGTTTVASVSTNLTANGGEGGRGSLAGAGTLMSNGAEGGTALGGDINVKGGGTSGAGRAIGSAIGSSMSGASFFGGGAKGILNANGVNATTYGEGGGSTSVSLLPAEMALRARFWCASIFNTY